MVKSFDFMVISTSPSSPADAERQLEDPVQRRSLALRITNAESQLGQLKKSVP
jgi:hypothetical protein